MEKLRISEVILVEGRYDAAALAGLVDGLILTTGGFSIFTNDEKQALIRRLGAERGLLILTDSDAAGFRIRHHIEKVAAGCEIKHAYIPALPGKESRKAAPSKEGTLGVEGMAPGVLLKALERAGVKAGPARQAGITHTHLYTLGISGGAGSAQRRRALLARLGLPPRLSKRALCEVLSQLYSYEELSAMLDEKPVLFWDFHGTLTLPDINWFDAAMEAAAEAVPGFALEQQVLTSHLGGTCLPWFTVPGRDTRHVSGSARWWAHSEANFEAMFKRCGMAADGAKAAAPLIREKILQPHRYRLYPDAVETLQALKKRGYRSYILSNNFPELGQVVAALGLDGLFEGVLSSGEVGYEKPRPELFRVALAAAGNPREAWMIGDNPADDLDGATAAGLVPVAVHGVQAQSARHSVGELAELLELLP